MMYRVLFWIGPQIMFKRITSEVLDLGLEIQKTVYSGDVRPAYLSTFAIVICSSSFGTRDIGYKGLLNLSSSPPKHTLTQ
jgi:hypothetical protein